MVIRHKMESLHENISDDLMKMSERGRGLL